MSTCYLCSRSPAVHWLLWWLDISSHVGAFGFRWFWDAVWMAPSAGSNLPFRDLVCARDDEVSFGIGSCHPTESSYLHLSMIIRWNVNSNRCGVSTFIRKCCLVFVYILVSESASTWSFELCTFGNMPQITWITSLATSFLVWVIQLQSAIIILLVAEWRLLSVDLQHAFQCFRLFNLQENIENPKSRRQESQW